jgi:hypothetical protein
VAAVGGHDLLIKQLLPVRSSPGGKRRTRGGPQPRGVLAPVVGNGELLISVDEPPMLLSYPADGFAQINLDQNKRLVTS